GVTSRTPASAALIQATARLAEGLASAPVAALAKTVCRGMLVARLKVAALILLATAVVSAFGYRLAVVGEPVQDYAKPNTDKQGAAGSQSRTDKHGDPLPSGAVARLGTLRFRHWAPVGDVAYSSDGKQLATAGTVDQQVRLWDATTGGLLASVPGHHRVVFTANGQRLFYAGGNTKAEAKFLDIPRLREEESPIIAVNSKCLALSPDGRSVALDTWRDKPPHEV